jgi:outer membrane immunogenic protein
MKKIVLATVLASLSSASALAADLPARAYTKAPVMAPASVYDWTGFYIGGHVGGAWAQSDWTFQNDSFFNRAVGDHVGIEPEGWLAGAHVGFNYQINQFVVGIEGTWSGSDLKQAVVSPFFPTSDTESTKISSLYTIAGRAGLAWNQFLVYGKGGWAGGQVELSAADNTDGAFWSPGRQSRSGWVAGAGVEYMLTPNFIVGVEYNHIDLGTANYSASNTGINTTLTSVDDRTKVDTVVGRISYKFGGLTAARY